jgi:hypothetical protein
MVVVAHVDDIVSEGGGCAECVEIDKRVGVEK